MCACGCKKKSVIPVQPAPPIQPAPPPEPVPPQPTTAPQARVIIRENRINNVPPRPKPHQNPQREVDILVDKLQLITNQRQI
jgi:outer membrane biosynthesis protein TonB